MLPRTRLVFLAVLSLTAAACGLKGPLYRPDEPGRGSVTPENPARTTTESAKKKSSSSGNVPGESSEPEVAPPDPDRPAIPPER